MVNLNIALKFQQDIDKAVQKFVRITHDKRKLREVAAYYKQRLKLALNRV